MSLNPEQVKIIKSTVPILKEHGNAITTRLYENMLPEVPELNNVFNHTNQINGRQATALAGGLYAYAAHIDNLGALSSALERINQKHASLYVQPSHYDIVGKYVLQAMKQVLGDALTPEIHDAWAAAYQQLANLMVKREDELLKEAGPWNDWRDFRIVQKVRESSEITSFHLAPGDGKPLPSFLPGQYISIRTSIPDFPYLQPRQYSLSDAPYPDHYRISVKREPSLDLDHPHAKAHPGYISNILHNNKDIGDVLQVSHPAGEYFLDTSKDSSSDSPTVLISAGVGLTPNLSILNTLVAKDTKRKTSWIHATRNSQVQAFGNHIKDIVYTHKNVQGYVFNKNPGQNDQKGVDYQLKGRMDLSKLSRNQTLFINDPRTGYFICGPEQFMTDMERVLLGWGVDGKRIKLEVFGTGEIPTS